MTDQQMIEAIAKAINAATRGRGVEPNSCDRDFAEKFLAAYRAAWNLQQEEHGQSKGSSAPVAASGAEGVLRQRPSGRWAVERPGHELREFASGDMLRLWVGGRFVTVRMEYSRTRPTGFYTVPRHELGEGGRVALFQPGDPG
jgi:hypothetical protein